MDKAWTTPSASSPPFSGQGRRARRRLAPLVAVRPRGAVPRTTAEHRPFKRAQPRYGVSRGRSVLCRHWAAGRFEKGDVPIVADRSRLAMNRAMFLAVRVLRRVGPPDDIKRRSGATCRRLRPVWLIGTGVRAWHGAEGVVHALSTAPFPIDPRGALVKGWATPRRPRPVETSGQPRACPSRIVAPLVGSALNWAMFRRPKRVRGAVSRDPPRR